MVEIAGGNDDGTEVVDCSSRHHSGSSVAALVAVAAVVAIDLGVAVADTKLEYSLCMVWIMSSSA